MNETRCCCPGPYRHSDTKFIISDHPVIAFNAKMQPSSSISGLVIEPPISFLGTHTVFPLDLDHCLILTHRQYALNPDDCNPLEDRINARYGDKAIFNLDSIIFQRNLAVDDVVRINHIVKKSSLRYVAASDREWLYPETSCGGSSWEQIGEVLLPPKEGITLTQSIVVGHRDGGSEGVDAFGRDISDSEKDDFRKVFRDIRLGKQISEILSHDSQTDLYQKNIVLLDSLKEIFQMSGGKTIRDLRKNLCEKQVSMLYQVVDELYPYKSKFCDLAPAKDDMFRGVLLGVVAIT